MTARRWSRQEAGEGSPAVGRPAGGGGYTAPDAGRSVVMSEKGAPLALTGPDVHGVHRFATSFMSRVFLRELEPGDAEALASLLRRNRSFLAPWDPERPESFFTVEGQRHLIEAGMEEREAGRGWSFAILEQATDELVGRIALSSVARGAWQSANVGYWVDSRRQGRGYATEALGGAVTVAFDELQLHRVQAAVMPRNTASIRVVEKNGFRQEGLARRYLLIGGRWEDHYLYALTREERQVGPGLVEEADVR
jgi:ribosomal-protein-alanine N-acetyltransferase